MASEGCSSSVRVFGFGEGGDGEEELQQHGDGEDEVEERLQDGKDAGDPEASGAGEEELGEEAVEDEDEEDEFAGGADDLAGAWGAGERGDEGGCGCRGAGRRGVQGWRG